jgi:TPR repeat protein
MLLAVGGALGAVLLLLVGLWFTGILHIGRPSEKNGERAGVAGPTEIDPGAGKGPRPPGDTRGGSLPPSTRPVVPAREPIFNPADPWETRDWFERVVEESEKNRSPNGLAEKERLQKLESDLNSVKGKEIRWESHLSSIDEDFADVSGLYSAKDETKTKHSMFLTLFPGTVPPALTSPRYGRMGFTPDQLGREQYLKLKHETPVVIVGEIHNVRRSEPLLDKDTFKRLSGPTIHIAVVNCRASLNRAGSTQANDPPKRGELSADIEQCRQLLDANKPSRLYFESTALRKIAQWRKAAEAGSPEGQYLYGRCCGLGTGTEIDQRQALTWYRKSAEQGFALAQAALADALERGDGVRKNAVEAVQWYRKAADQGLAVAQTNLGVCYSEGSGVEKDDSEAVKWFTRAAEQGYVIAQQNLGFCYYNGIGIDQDYAQAAIWLRKAAEQGDVLAQFNLGQCYYKGRGVAKDFAEAVKWYRKASGQGCWQATGALSLLYENGEGVPKDQAEADRLLKLATEQAQKEKK